MKRILVIFLVICTLLTAFASCNDTEAPTTGAADTQNKTSSRLTAPEDVSFIFDIGEPWFLNGTITVTMPEKYNADSIRMFWADSDGNLLKDHTSLAPFKITDVVTAHLMSDSILIPQSAASILVFSADYSKNTVSDKYIKIDLPRELSGAELEEPVFEIQVASDTHIESKTKSDYNVNYSMLLDSIKEYSPDSKGLFINGDITDSGLDAEYRKLYQLTDAHMADLSLYLGIGNHDYYDFKDTQDYQAAVNRFLDYAVLPSGDAPTDVNYDFWLSGYHFIMLGSDIYPTDNTDAYIDSETLEWLDNTLALNRDTARPTFVFLHQGLFNTVAGTLPEDGWDGVTNDRELKDILSKYPEVILFSSHSHWPMDSPSNILYRTDSMPTVVNTASLAYLCDAYSDNTAVDVEGSQCYFISVYRDKVIIRGRDILSEKWIASAQYLIDYSSDTATADPALDSIYGMDFKGIQVDENGTSLRLISTVNSRSYSKIGYMIKASYSVGSTEINASYDISASELYSSVSAIANGASSIITAEQLGGKYICSVILPLDTALAGDVKYEITPYVCDQSENRYLSKEIHVIYGDGKISYR